MVAPASPPPPGGTWSPTPNAPPYGAPVPVQKPTVAMVLSVVGGVFILLGGAVLIEIGSIFTSLTFGVVGGGVIALGAVGAILGLLTIVLAILLYLRPAQHTIFGVLILVFSIISWVTAFGGFFIGFLLALIGGILAITFKPNPPVVWQPPA